MTVSIEPLAIGHENGPIVYILIRQVGRHKDIEQMPDDITTNRQAVAFAASRWRISELDVQWLPRRVVELESPS